MISNHEEFADNLQKIEYYGSNDFPPKKNKKWINLGSVYPSEHEEQHLLEIDKEAHPET
jgi:hypothetical protein